MTRGVVGALILVALIAVGCGPRGEAPVSGRPSSGSGVGEALGALTVGGCECQSWQAGVDCHDISYSDIPADNKYYVTTFGGPGDGQDMWVCGHKTTDNGSWAYAAGYARFGCTKIKVVNPQNGQSCIAEVADCGPNRCVEEAACYCNCQGHHPVLDVSPFVTQFLFGISSSGWSERRVVVAYPVDPATPIGCPGGPEPLPDVDGDGVAAGADCDDQDASVHPGAGEVCNGRDDDCDGQTDGGLTRACASTCGAGFEHCERGQWTDCDAPEPVECRDPDSCEVRPTCDTGCPPLPAETCNGRDDDCDGQTDEDFAGLHALCSVGAGECLRFGFTRCAADGGGVLCGATPGEPGPEVCDGRDNDCDGLTDEGVCVACVPGEVRPCAMPDGTTGAMTCGPGAVYGPCVMAADGPEAVEEGGADETAWADDVARTPDLGHDEAWQADEVLAADVAPGRLEVLSDRGADAGDAGSAGAGGCRAGPSGGALLVLPGAWAWWVLCKRRKVS